MRQRFLTITVLGIAVLFSQGGNFLVASLCPHLRSGMASCESQAAAPTMSHHDMGHMGMKHETNSAPSADPHQDLNSVAVSQQHGPCPHCAVHSRTIPRAASLRETEAPKKSTSLSLALHSFRVAPVTESAVAVLNSRAHGPPGDPTARYILINIFRI